MTTERIHVASPREGSSSKMDAKDACEAQVCPDGCGCRLDDTLDGAGDADRADCGCTGPCTMECLENGYPDAPSYRDLAVAAERERIRQLAIKTRAVTVSQTGRMMPFEELLRHSPEENEAALLKAIEDAQR